MNKWSERDGGQIKRQIDEAKQFLMKAGKASNPIKGVTSRCKMLPADRELMSEDMLADEASEVFTRVAPPKAFPKDTKGRHTQCAWMHSKWA